MLAGRMFIIHGPHSIQKTNLLADRRFILRGTQFASQKRLKHTKCVDYTLIYIFI